MMPWRRVSVLVVFVGLVVLLAARAMDMQVLHSAFFEQQGDARQLRNVTIPANRGDIVDRNGEPLAISTPVSSIWLNPQAFDADAKSLKQLARMLSIDTGRLKKKIETYQDREFMYLKRHVSPELADKVLALNIKGIALQDEYRRYYPAGEVAAHIIGFADIDDNGQEGMELAFDEWLKGEPGRKQVIRDRYGRAVDDVKRIRSSEPGKPIRLSVDKRLQYLTYRTLKAAVLKHNAVAGSAVVLDVDSGEVLAIANQPSFNVNNRSQLNPGSTRNRAVTDVYEPGSTMKPLTVAAALESGRWRDYYKVETGPGYMQVMGNTIRDTHNYGDLDVSGVIMKSSNVGISKIALSLDAEQQWSMYQKLGFGSDTGSGFPGEASGRLSVNAINNDFERATLAFGYGVSVTSLQLARAYAAIAADGYLKPVSFLHREQSPQGERVMAAETAAAVRRMMQRVVSSKGTGKQAKVANYSVAGKTGTVHKFTAGGYADDRYLSIFTGMVPAEDPKLVMVVMIDEPRNGEYFGGEVSAPVFSKVMAGAMRLLDVPPDSVEAGRLVLDTRSGDDRDQDASVSPRVSAASAGEHT
ncbi:MAG: penicillin-binding protein 2 [Gammaproteobacteria bacterium]|nr:penicillin-binding protein 2 [Gammaproteobacteria bacterium]NNL07129.1 penicillin-binding protein 2 [Gammaproteobacteria bacterium]